MITTKKHINLKTKKIIFRKKASYENFEYAEKQNPKINTYKNLKHFCNSDTLKNIYINYYDIVLNFNNKK